MAEWADYAKGNSYQCDKQALKHNLSTEGANVDYAAHDVKEWKQPQKSEEGRGWATPINKAAVPNTYTGKGGTTRD